MCKIQAEIEFEFLLVQHKAALRQSPVDTLLRLPAKLPCMDFLSLILNRVPARTPKPHVYNRLPGRYQLACKRLFHLLKNIAFHNVVTSHTHTHHCDRAQCHTHTAVTGHSVTHTHCCDRAVSHTHCCDRAQCHTHTPL